MITTTFAFALLSVNKLSKKLKCMLEEKKDKVCRNIKHSKLSRKNN